MVKKLRNYYNIKDVMSCATKGRATGPSPFGSAAKTFWKGCIAVADISEWFRVLLLRGHEAPQAFHGG